MKNAKANRSAQRAQQILGLPREMDPDDLGDIGYKALMLGAQMRLKDREKPDFTILSPGIRGIRRTAKGRDPQFRVIEPERDAALT